VQATRRAILSILKKTGQASVDELGRRLGLTSMCVRQHLAILERDRLIRSHEERQKLGRPRLVYTLTEHAEEFFPKNYSQLLDWILDEIKGGDGLENIESLFDRLAERMANQFQSEIADKPLRERMAAICAEMNVAGSLAEWEERDGTYCLHEHNCRYHSVAAKHPDICRMELSFLRRVLDAEVTMVECLLHDGPRCSYVIRPRPVG